MITVHQVPKAAVGVGARIEVKFMDDADDNGHTPARSLRARYVMPLPKGFDEEKEQAKIEEEKMAERVIEPGGAGGGPVHNLETDEVLGEAYF